MKRLPLLFAKTAALFLLSWGLGFPAQTLAQEIAFRQYTLDDGLLSASITSITQDQQGHMWFFGIPGATRFSGRDWRAYSYNNSNLKMTMVYGSFTSRDGDLWCYGPGKGMFFQNQGDFQLYNFTNAEEFQKWRREDLNLAIRDDQDTIWMAAISSTSPFKAGPDTILRQIEVPEASSLTYHVQEKGDQLFYFRAGGGRCDSVIIHYRNRQLVAHLNKAIPSNRSNCRIIRLPNGDLLLTHFQFLIRFNETGVQEMYEMPSQVMNALMLDHSGNLWVGTRSHGLWKFDGASFAPEARHHYLDNEMIYAVFEDRENGLWVSVENKGIFYCSNTEVTLYRTLDGIGSDRIKAYRWRDDTLWVATRDGSVITVGENRVQELLPSSQLNIGGLKDLDFDAQGNLWLTGRNGTFQLVEGKLEFRAKDVGWLTPDPDSGMWIGSHGVQHWIKDRLEFDSRDQDFSRVIWNILTTPDGRVWFRSFSSEPWQLVDGNIELIRTEPQPIGGSLNIRATWANHFYSQDFEDFPNFYCDHKRIDWNGYHSEILQETGVWSMDVYQNQIWVGSLRGLVRIDLDSHHAKVIGVQDFSIGDGIVGQEIKELLATEDHLWALSNLGLQKIPYESLKPNPVAPPIQITGIQVNGRDTPMERGLTFRHDQNLIKFSFQGMTFKEPKKTSFRYRLNPTNARWVSTGDNSVQFSSLPPGDYEFSVLAGNHQGVFGHEPATFAITITPPIWGTWWFRVLAVLLFIGMVWVGFAWRYRNIRIRLSYREESLDAQKMALRAQLTPHFLFNALNSIQLLISQNERIAAMTNVAKFARLMRKILHSSDSDFIMLREEVESLQLYLEIEATRFEGRFTFEIDTQSVPNTRRWLLPPMLIQPFVENAIWHGIMKKVPQQGHVRIGFEASAHEMKCSIEDNGVGRQQAGNRNDLRLEGGKSKGLELINRSIDITNKQYNTAIRYEIIDLFDSQKIPAGTRVELVFPNFDSRK